MEKIGSNIKIDLINAHGIHEALTNDFENEYLGKKQVFHYCTKEEINDDILREYRDVLDMSV